MISDHMVDAFNRAYSATWEASAPITTQGEATSVEREAVRAGIEAALDLTHTMQRTDDIEAAFPLTDDELQALDAAARRWVNAGNGRSSTPLARALAKLANRPPADR